MWSLGCIIFELFNLSIYNKDKIFNEIKQIDNNNYNIKWQVLIDSLLELDYKKRFDIYQVNQFLENKLNKKNIMIGEIIIDKWNVSEDIQIINSFENYKRDLYLEDKDDDWEYEYENEKEIKENLEIKIYGKLTEFTYKYKFNKEGIYIIEYSFKNNLTKTCYMFYKCYSLTNLDLSNFNTKKVIDMSYMFYDCNSLKNLNLLNFNTKNATNMSYMFSYCTSLTNLNLSNFNTKKVTNMSYMFYGCTSLTNLNLSNFNTKKVTDMSYMFYVCYSLKNLNLSNFNTQNVTNMNSLFNRCYSLTNLDISNFHTHKGINISSMFDDCYSLKKENIITKDNRILNNSEQNCMIY